MENPSLRAGASETCQLGGDTRKHTAPRYNVQDTLDRAMRHEWPAAALGGVLAVRLGRRPLLMLAAGALHGLDAETREELCEVVLHDLREGAPPPPFGTLKDEAEAWAMFASPAERKWFMAAIWRELPPDDRRAFLRRAL